MGIGIPLVDDEDSLRRIEESVKLSVLCTNYKGHFNLILFPVIFLIDLVTGVHSCVQAGFLCDRTLSRTSETPMRPRSMFSIDRRRFVVFDCTNGGKSWTLSTSEV